MQCYRRIIRPLLIRSNCKFCFCDYNKNDFFKSLQEQDVDLLIENSKEEIKKISLKAQKVLWGSIFAETISNKSTNQEGWASYCKADLIFYTVINETDFSNYKIYIFNPKNLQKLDLTKYKVENGTTKTTNCYYHSEGRIVPIGDIPGLITLNPKDLL